MAKTLYIFQQSTLDQASTRKALNETINNLKDRYGISGEWKSERLLAITGQGVSGMIDISSKGEIVISVSLGTLLSPFAPMIENQIIDQLAKNLG